MLTPREERFEHRQRFVDSGWSDFLDPTEFHLLNFCSRYLCQWKVPAEFSLPELQDRLDKRLVRPVMRLRIAAVFVECGAEDDIFRNQYVPASILDFRDL